MSVPHSRPAHVDRRVRRVAVSAVIVSLLASVLVVSGISGAAPTRAAMVSTLRAPDRYTPQTGPLFNDPTSDARRRVIRRHLMRSINSTPTGATIRVASWNIASDGLVDALIRAHRRGVGVRTVMSRAVASRQGDSYNARLTRALSRGNANRPPALKSYARTCRSSCRGNGGIAHTKMYLFSRVGRASDVVMVSSANFTDAAGANQWNDIYTVTGRPALSRKFEQIFTEMTRDRWARPPYQTKQVGPYLATFLPYQGRTAKGDLVLRELGRVRCAGARGGTGANGHTVIRIAQTAIVGKRGLRIAERLRQMDARGCDIRILYAVAGREVRRVLNAAGIPNRAYVQDTSGDGVYDNYLHAKVMTVSGVYGGSSAARVAWNGSQNWSPVALASDEAGFRIQLGWVQRTYAGWFNSLWSNMPENAAPIGSGGVVTTRVTPEGDVLAQRTMPSGETVNPYQNIQVN